jgi:hypothetical protein
MNYIPAAFAQRLRSCSKIGHVKCSEMYLKTNRILNHSQLIKTSAEERDYILNVINILVYIRPRLHYDATANLP